MKQIFFLLILIPISIFSQDAENFKGKIGENKIEMFLNFDWSNYKVHGIYKYEKFNNIISIDGKIGEPIEIIEYQNNLPFAKLTFSHFNDMNNPIVGIWKKLNDNKEIPIEIKNTEDILCANKACFYEKAEILQKKSTKYEFFKLEIQKNEDNNNPIVTSINVYSKKTGKLIKKIPCICPYKETNSIEIGDFNFDGIEDFSIYKSSNKYIRKYYFIKSKNKFLKVNFYSDNLIFDKNKKVIKRIDTLKNGKIKISKYYFDKKSNSLKSKN